MKKINYIQRYSSQVRLHEIGPLGQEALAQSRVLIVGLGGLGCPAALYLAAAGVGTVGLVDQDAVDESNLHRQILYETQDIGRKKVEVAKEKLQLLNPDLDIYINATNLDSNNAIQIASQYDVIVDATDNFPSKFLLNDVAVKLDIPLVYGSISGFLGQIAVFDAAFGPCYRCLYPQPPKSDIGNCSVAGILGAVAGVVGSLQALETIKWLVFRARSKSRLRYVKESLFSIDLMTLQIEEFQLKKNPQCPVCSLPVDRIKLEEVDQSCSIAITNQNSEYSALNEIRAQAKTGLCHFIDVRENEEWKKGHIDGAIHWPLSKMERGELPVLSKEKINVIYCQGGKRSARACVLLGQDSKSRNANIVNLAGGYGLWIQFESA